jgi:hypothetical protein
MGIGSMGVVWRGYANDPLLGKTFEIDRENPAFEKTTLFQNPGDATYWEELSTKNPI